jgi:hypothetical protein
MEVLTPSHETSQMSMSFLYDFHNLMEENDIIMVYQGDFSQDFIKTVLSFTELKFNSEEIGNTLKRKIFNLMVECLQNISKHQFEDKSKDPRLTSLFMIGYTDEDYLIVSSNPIYNRNIPKLKDLFDEVNSYDKDELKELYKKKRIENAFSASSGAGIGIIDMARKSGKKLEYNFQEINDEISIYSLLVRVPKK